jgi:hypothetical protein
MKKKMQRMESFKLVSLMLDNIKVTQANCNLMSLIKVDNKE